MNILLNIGGLSYILIQYFFSKNIIKHQEKNLILLKISISFYFDFLFLSIFNILNFKSLITIAFIKFIYISLNKKFTINFRNINDESIKNILTITNIFIFITYFIYGYLFEKFGFTIDDVLVSYLTRVNQWIQNETMFLDLDLFPYYSTILTYPVGGVMPLLLTRIFKLPVSIYFIISFFISIQIIETINRFFNLNQLEQKIVKFSILLSPVVLTLSSSGLTDLFFTYFLLNSFFYLTEILDSDFKKNLFLTSLFAIFSINVRYHGVFVLFIIGLFLLKNFKLRNIFDFSKYTLINIFLFLTPNLIWQYKNNNLNFLLNNANRQFFRENPYSQQIDTEILNSIQLSDFVLNFYNSFSHTLVNYLFADFPFIFLLKESNNSFVDFLIRFNVFYKFNQISTPGAIILIFTFFAIIFLIVEFYKNSLKNKFSRNIANFLVFLFFSSLFFLFFENFYLSTVITVLIIVSLLFSKKFFKNDYRYIFQKKYINLFLIFLIYFFLVSLRDFNDTNLRYLFPIFFLVFPIGVKLFSDLLSKAVFRIILYVFIIVTSIQPIFLSKIVTTNIYPEYSLDSTNVYENYSRSWASCKFDVIAKGFIAYENLINFDKSYNSIISLNRIFPISIFNKNNIYFKTVEKSEYITVDFFKYYNSNIFIVDQDIVFYDNKFIEIIDIRESVEVKDVSKNYFILNLQDLSCY